jgi:hypothetical protein
LIKLEIVKIKIENLREVLKFLFMFLLSLLTGEVILVFKILNNEAKTFLVIFIGIGIIIIGATLYTMKYVFEKMNENIKEIENE